MPIIYNVTVQADKLIAGEWMQWMRKEHIPAIMQTGLFTNYKILRLLDIDDSEGPTYAIQYTAATLEDYRQYESSHAPALLEASFTKWGDAFMAFGTIMEVVQ